MRLKSAAGRWVIAATVLGSAMVFIDGTVVNIALPAIGGEFGTGLASLQWTITAYILTLASFILIGGALGDRYGRRRVFVIGVVWFAAASLLCVVAPSATFLIAARALQGVGGALLTPGSLAIIEATFASEDRAQAIGLWSGVSGIAVAIGPFIGGYLIEAVSWRLIFLINLPLAAVVVWLAERHVPESRDEAATGRLDVAGATLASLGLGALVWGLIEGPVTGWAAPSVAGALVAGVALLGVFVVVESRRHDPMLPLSIFRSRTFSGANAMTLLVYGALGGAMFLIPLQLQQSLGYSPVEAGLALMPITLLLLLLSPRAGRLSQRLGPRLPMTLGPVVAGAGLALLWRVEPGTSYLTAILPGIAVFGLGLSLLVAPLTATVLAAAPTRHAGLASAVNNAVARAAGLIVVAALPAIAGLTGAVYGDPARFSDGFGIAMLICAGLCLAGGVIAYATVPGRAATQARTVTSEFSCAVDAPPLRSDACEAGAC